MELFSERLGYKPKKALQVEAMDDGLRIRLWNIVSRHLRLIHYLDRADHQGFLQGEVWDKYLKRSADELSDDHMQRLTEMLKAIERKILHHSWFEVYDLLEFVAQEYPIPEYEDVILEAPTVTAFVEETNRVLKEEVSGYRFIGDSISPIMSQEETKEVEVALDSLAPVAAHVKRALELLSNRKQPDYRNSIKEATSAVESIANLIAKERGKSLGDILPQLEKQLGLQLHGALRKALGSLYGWTSDEGGVRHALLEESDLTQEDARFMLIVCSAFVNYLKTKTANAGISLDANV